MVVYLLIVLWNRVVLFLWNRWAPFTCDTWKGIKQV